jgi:addiction module HigA family antidote
VITVESVVKQSAQPTGPGSYLRQLFHYAKVTQEEFAGAIGTSRFTISQIISGRRAVTPAMALKLSKGTGTSLDICLNLQRDIDLWEAYQDIRQDLERIETVRKPVLAFPAPAENELERIAESLFSAGLKPIEDAALVAFPATSARSTGHAVALSLDNLQGIADVVGLGNGRAMLEKLLAEVNVAVSCLKADLYHYGLVQVHLSTISRRVSIWKKRAFQTRAKCWSMAFRIIVWNTPILVWRFICLRSLGNHLSGTTHGLMPHVHVPGRHSPPLR